MSDQRMPEATDAAMVRKVVTVQAPPEVAWRVFTEQMSTWWPLLTHKIGDTRAIEAVIEPRAGGRWYERGEDGSTCDWGRVLLWEPCSRLVLSWEITANWRHEPSLKTEVEVRFIADGRDRTRVELEHRRLDLYGAHRDQMRGVFDSEKGWKGLLDAYAARVSGGTSV
jgi:uncharacterized protein YndB with AHSA1/START domain